MTGRMSNQNVYDSRKPLTTCHYPNLERQVGVIVSKPFFHVGRKAPCVHTYYEMPILNTITYGGVIPMEDWKTNAAQDTARIIEDLERIITELQDHKRRLQKDLNKLQGADPNLIHLFEISGLPEAKK